MNDPKLSSEPAVAKEEASNHVRTSESENEGDQEENEVPEETYYLGKGKEEELLRRRFVL